MTEIAMKKTNAIPNHDNASRMNDQEMTQACVAEFKQNGAMFTPTTKDCLRRRVLFHGFHLRPKSLRENDVARLDAVRGHPVRSAFLDGFVQASNRPGVTRWRKLELWPADEPHSAAHVHGYRRKIGA